LSIKNSLTNNASYYILDAYTGWNRMLLQCTGITCTLHSSSYDGHSYHTSSTKDWPLITSCGAKILPLHLSEKKQNLLNASQIRWLPQHSITDSLKHRTSRNRQVVLHLHKNTENFADLQLCLRLVSKPLA